MAQPPEVRCRNADLVARLYPAHKVRTALVYTAGPSLVEIPGERRAGALAALSPAQAGTLA